MHENLRVTEVRTDMAGTPLQKYRMVGHPSTIRSCPDGPSLDRYRRQSTTPHLRKADFTPNWNAMNRRKGVTEHLSPTTRSFRDRNIIGAMSPNALSQAELHAWETQCRRTSTRALSGVAQRLSGLGGVRKSRGKLPGDLRCR
jgi:hypothetical protein